MTFKAEVLGVCDLCDREVTEEDESQFDADGFMHQACIDQATDRANGIEGESDGSE